MQYVDTDFDIDSWHSHKIVVWATYNESQNIDSKAGNRTQFVISMTSLEVEHQPSVTCVASLGVGH